MYPFYLSHDIVTLTLIFPIVILGSPAVFKTEFHGIPHSPG